MNLVTGDRPGRVVALGRAGRQPPRRALRRRACPDIIDNAYVVVEYAGGVRAMLDLCMFAEASKNEQELVVTGDEGKVEALVSESLVRIGRRADGIGAVTELAVADDAGAGSKASTTGSSYLEHLDFLEAIRTGASGRGDAGGWHVVGGDRRGRPTIDRRAPLGGDRRSCVAG